MGSRVSTSASTVLYLLLKRVKPRQGVFLETLSFSRHSLISFCALAISLLGLILLFALVTWLYAGMASPLCAGENAVSGLWTLWYDDEHRTSTGQGDGAANVILAFVSSVNRNHWAVRDALY
jgi:hypothetical protein